MKRFLFIPTLIFPYTVCLFLGYGFVTQNFSDITIKILAILALVTLVLSFLCNLIYIFIGKEDAIEKLFNTAFFIKVVHIPTYILIFILGIIMGLMFFVTLPFIVFLVLIDLFTLWISGMLSIYSISKALKKCGHSFKPLLIVAMICQLFFCADIISLFTVMIVLKKNKQCFEEI